MAGLDPAIQGYTLALAAIGRSPKLAAFVAFAGPLDLLTRFARRSSPMQVPAGLPC